jgi:hypothetical protein
MMMTRGLAQKPTAKSAKNREENLTTKDSLEVISKMLFLSPMSFPHVVGGNPDLAQNSPIDLTVHV